MKTEKIFPAKLSPGDEVRVISPARSLAIISPSVRSLAIKRLDELGLKVSFSKHCEERDLFNSSSIASRLEDIHEAFANPKIKAILTTIGGSNSIQLLKGLDYELIRKNPKILCGYSDITTLQNAIFAKTGLVTYSGPHFSTFGCEKGIDYVINSFQKCLFGTEPTSLLPSPQWSDDEWFLDQNNRTFMANPGYTTIHPGEATGTIIGGNVDSLTVLQGTEYMPSLKDAVLFLEDNYPMTADILDRHLHSLILQKDFPLVKALVLGRFQVASKITTEQLKALINAKPELKAVPIMIGADFGHTMPMFTFPIGGNVKLECTSTSSKLTLLDRRNA